MTEQSGTTPPGEPQRVGGSCFCGDVVFEIELPTIYCGHCHCSMCRRPHGAAYVTWVGVEPRRFEVIRGERSLTEYRSSERATRAFCRRCGTYVYCRPTDGESVAVPLACLHGEIDRQPEGHVYYDSRANWTVVNDGLPKYGGESGFEPL